MVEIPDWTKIEHKEMNRDDFIEYILHNTGDDTLFRVNETKSYINVGIDRPVKREE